MLRRSISSLRDIPIDSIVPGPYNSRSSYSASNIREMASSLECNGQIVPIRVRPSPKIEGKFELIYGHRRYFAARSLNWKSIRAEVGMATEDEMLEQSLVENLERKELSDYEKALIFERINKEFSKTFEQIGHIVGYSKQHISNCVSMLKLFDAQTLSARPEIREALNHITEHHARILARVTDVVTRANLLLLVVKEKLTVADLNNMASKLRGWFPLSDSTAAERKLELKKEKENGSKNKDIGDITEIVLTIYRLAEVGDFQKIMQMDIYDDNFNFYSAFLPFEKVEGGNVQQMLHSVFGEILPRFVTKVNELRVNVYDNFGIVTLTVSHFEKFSNKQFEAVRGSMIFRKVGSKWRIIHEHWSRGASESIGKIRDEAVRTTLRIEGRNARS